MGVEEEENGGSGTPGAAKGGCIRIYVGGLGTSVSADDLKKTFSSPQLGNVDSVEIVRTKGRSFAYLDFLPISDKGLAKLFSMYNGCIWKGGRLRLEKAKEHYFLRLKREWAEDMELTSESQNPNVDTAENPHSSGKLLKIHDSEKQLRIFFPKLRKVKPLPFKGTGKHKYSFQHIQVPPLPIHFCDCEEHCVSYEPAKEEGSTDHHVESGGMNEEELSMMNSIISKIFQRESCSEIASRTDEFETEADNTTSLNEDLQFDDALTDQESDEDNLIINVVTGLKSSINPSSSTWGTKAITANQASKTRPVQRMPRSKAKMSSNKKRKAPYDEEVDTNDTSVNAEKKVKLNNIADGLEIIPDTEPIIPRSDNPQSSYNPTQSRKSAFRNLVSDKDNATFCISNIAADVGLQTEAPSKSDNASVHGHVMEEKQKTEHSQPIEENRSTVVVSNVPNAEINKSSKNWLQKSSWMQLVGGSTDSSFSISQILPGLSVEKQELQPLKGGDSSIPINGNNQYFSKAGGSVSTTDFSRPWVKENNDFPGLDGGSQPNPAKKLQANGGGNEASTSSPSNKHLSLAKQTSGRSTGTSEDFTFMRSASSMKEWMKTKVALSSSLKKKRNEK